MASVSRGSEIFKLWGQKEKIMHYQQNSNVAHKICFFEIYGKHIHKILYMM